MIARITRSLAAALLGAAVAMALLQRVEPPQRLPLVHASLSVCAPLPEPPEADEQPPQPSNGPHTAAGDDIV